MVMSPRGTDVLVRLFQPWLVADLIDCKSNYTGGLTFSFFNGVAEPKPQMYLPVPTPLSNLHNVCLVRSGVHTDLLPLFYICENAGAS